MKTKNLATSKVVSFDSEGPCFSTKVLLDFFITYGKCVKKIHAAKEAEGPPCCTGIDIERTVRS